MDILQDITLQDRHNLRVEEKTEGQLTLLSFRKVLKALKRRYQKVENPLEDPESFKTEHGSGESKEVDVSEEDWWRVTPYDLGGHTSYFNSQKLFTSDSSVFFLAFQRSFLIDFKLKT